MRCCLQLDKLSITYAKEFLELNWFNVHGRYPQFIVTDILSFTTISFLTIFRLVDDSGVATPSCNKKLKLSFRKSKLGMQTLSYVGVGIYGYVWDDLDQNFQIFNH